MAKIAGNAATKITELRKALDAAEKEIEHLRSRHLQNENAKLRRENEVLRAILDSVGKLECTPTNHSTISKTASSSPAVRLGKAATSNPAEATPATRTPSSEASTPRSPTTDLERSTTIDGRKYVYRNGELLLLDDRQSTVFSKPRFTHPTRSSEGRKLEQEPFEYLKKKVSPAKRYEHDSTHDPEGLTWSNNTSGFGTSTGTWTSWNTVGDSDDWGTSTESIESPENTEPIAEQTKADKFRLHDYLDEDLKYMLVSSAFGLSILQKGLQLVQVVFWEQARLHWPCIFEEIKSGPHMVKMSFKEMTYYMNRLSINDLKLVSSDPYSLRYDLLNRVKDTRNLVAHPDEWSLTNTNNLDHHLLDIQRVVYIMGDVTRTQEVRALRDEIAAEAERVRDKMMALDYLVALPMCEICPDDEDMEWFREHDSRFAQVLRERYGRLNPAEDYLLRVAEFYVTKSANLKGCCRKLMGDQIFWRYTAARPRTAYR